MVSQKNKDTVWTRATPIRGKNPSIWRQDAAGNPIRYNSYGTEGQYSWQVDHIRPKAKGGSTSLRNLQALSTKLNREKSDSY